MSFRSKRARMPTGQTLRGVQKQKGRKGYKGQTCKEWHCNHFRVNVSLLLNPMTLSNLLWVVARVLLWKRAYE